MLQGTLNNNSIYISKLKELPTIPLKNQQLLALINTDSSDIDIDYLSSCIQEDPSLTAKLIGMANSAYFNPSGVILSVDDAIIKALGLNLVKALVLSMLLDSNLSVSDSKRFPVNQFWTESLSVAFLSKALATRSTLVEINPDECYLCALLHKIGVLALAHLFSDEMDEVLSDDTIIFDRFRLAEQEQRVLGFDHSFAGETVAHKWGLPESIGVVMANQMVQNYQGEYDKTVYLI